MAAEVSGVAARACSSEICKIAAASRTDFAQYSQAVLAFRYCTAPELSFISLTSYYPQPLLQLHLNIRSGKDGLRYHVARFSQCAHLASTRQTTRLHSLQMLYCHLVILPSLARFFLRRRSSAIIIFSRLTSAIFSSIAFLATVSRYPLTSRYRTTSPTTIVEPGFEFGAGMAVANRVDRSSHFTSHFTSH